MLVGVYRTAASVFSMNVMVVIGPTILCLEAAEVSWCVMRRLVQQGQQAELAWEGESRWIPISAALLGEVGRMQVLTPSILVHPAPEAPPQVYLTSTQSPKLQPVVHVSPVPYQEQ